MHILVDLVIKMVVPLMILREFQICLPGMWMQFTYWEI